MQWVELESSVRKSLVPGFSLPDSDGQTVTRTQFRQKKHLVLVFLPDPDLPQTRALIESLAAEHDEFRLANAVVFGVSPAAGPESSPLPTLVDNGGTVRTGFATLLPAGKQPADDVPFLVILNRYGVLEVVGVDLSDGDTIAKQVTTYIWSLEYQCSL